MAKGYKTGGRSKGTLNKTTEAVTETLEALGCNPIERIARIAMDETAELGLRAQMYKELAQYVAPKRKGVEVTGEESDLRKGGFTLAAFLEQHDGMTVPPPCERVGMARDVIDVD
jgi:hypothetical protein